MKQIISYSNYSHTIEYVFKVDFEKDLENDVNFWSMCYSFDSVSMGVMSNGTYKEIYINSRNDVDAFCDEYYISSLINLFASFGIKILNIKTKKVKNET
jgi:hypothetical protein